MFIKEIGLKNFRNYSDLNITPSVGVNILCGDNAAGKTNVLEAIYAVCTAKSLRAVREREMIGFDEDEAHLRALIDKKGINYRIDMHLRKQRSRGIAINGVSIRKISELIGIAHVISFSPEDLNIIKSGPSERRRFLDLALCQLDKIYVHDLISYNRVINQKNKLLKNYMYEKNAEEFLDIYDEQLIGYGTSIIKARKDFIGSLGEAIKDIHRTIADAEELSLIYDFDTDEDHFAGELRKHRAGEIKNMAALVGPHRDDIRFFINGRDLRRYGSQGQQRTAVVSLKLAEIRIVSDIIGDNPVLLLDDVLSELDKGRQELLLDNLGGIQTFISCTGLDEFVNHRFHIDRVFDVSKGTILERKS